MRRGGRARITGIVPKKTKKQLLTLRYSSLQIFPVQWLVTWNNHCQSSCKNRSRLPFNNSKQTEAKTIPRDF